MPGPSSTQWRTRRRTRSRGQHGLGGVGARDAAAVERDRRLYGVAECDRRAVKAPYNGTDRSGHWCALTDRLLRCGVPDPLIAEATRVSAWGYGEAYRSSGRGEGWLRATPGGKRRLWLSR